MLPFTMLVSMFIDGIVDDGVLGSLTPVALTLLTLAWLAVLAIGPRSLLLARRDGDPSIGAQVWVWASHGFALVLGLASLVLVLLLG